jgi:hypothetical protein
MTPPEKADKADKADVKLSGDLNREARGSTYGYDHGHSANKSLSQEFEAGSAREKQQVPAKWRAICEERRTERERLATPAREQLVSPSSHQMPPPLLRFKTMTVS